MENRKAQETEKLQLKIGGMACSFCAKVEVSLKDNRARVTIEGNHTIHQATFGLQHIERR